ncbi:MAG TPA: hypothetical protein VE871_01770 [Longimicrobium sp.]|nr:hypothetical protein [Longimicrobium sp.]
MTPMIDAVRRVPRAFARILAITGLSLAAAVAHAPAAAAQEGMEVIQQMFSDPALASYRLTSANLDKFLAATQALQSLEGEEFDIEDRFDGENPQNMNIGYISSAFESEPRVKGAINGAGMTTRDYVTFLFSTMQAMFGWAMVQMGGEDALAQMPAGVLKQNVEFFMANHEAFEALDMGS